MTENFLTNVLKNLNDNISKTDNIIKKDSKTDNMLKNSENMLNNSENRIKNSENQIKNSEKILQIDSKLVINENPFHKSKYTKIPEKKEIQKKVKSETVISLNLLLKKKIRNSNIPVKIPKGIYSECKIYSKNPISIKNFKYYIFPFDQKIKNDESENFYKIYQIYLKALKSAFSMLKKNGSKFLIQFEGGLIFFGEFIKCTLNLQTFMKVGDIKFTRLDGMLIIEDSANMVMDMLINYKITKNNLIPFILGYDEFDYSIVRFINVQNGPIIKNGNVKEHIYTINGPMYSEDLNLPDEVRVKYF